MKHFYSIFYFLVLVNLSFYSQGSPNSFKYQAIARDVNGNPIVSSDISLEIAIKSGSCNGQIIYQEQFFVTTTFGVLKNFHEFLLVIRISIKNEPPIV